MKKSKKTNKDISSIHNYNNTTGTIISGDNNSTVINENSQKTKITPKLFSDYYLTHFQTISLLTTDTLQPIEDIFVNLAIIKEEEKKESKELLPTREALLNSYEEIHKPKEPIAIEEVVKSSNKSFIYGKAGIGKTTLCKYIAYKWAKGELYEGFEYVVYLPLREWKNDGIRGAIRNYYLSHDVKEIGLEFDEKKILFLFDGYDELDNERKKRLQSEIDKNALTHYIITSRPYGYQKGDFRVDEYFETIGFTDENVSMYIDNFFEKKSEKAKGLKVFLQTNMGIRHIGYVPLMLEMICFMWKQKEFNDTLTMTELYTNVVEDMLNKHSAKKDDERVYKRKNRKKIKEQLGKLAFEGLKSQTIFFDGDFIEKCIDESEFFEEHVIYSGFLKSDVKEKDLLDNNFEFPHLTFQEYFSALYVSTLSQEEQSQIVRDWKFYPHFQVFFAFLAGLIDDKEFLIGEIEREPRDIVGYYEFLLILSCYAEMKDVEIDIQAFNEELSKWIRFAVSSSNNGYNLFDKLEGVSEWISEDTLDYLLVIVRFEGMEFQSMGILKVLLSIKRDDDKIVDGLIDIIKSKSISFFHTEPIIKALSNIERDDDKIVDVFIEIIKDEKIDDFSYKEMVAKTLSNIKRDDDEIVDIFIEIIKNEEINTSCKKEVVKALSGIKRDDDKIVDIFIKIIKDEKTDVSYRVNIATGLSNIKRDDDKIVDILIEMIKDEKIGNLYRGVVATGLSNTKRDDDRIVDVLIDVIKNEKIKPWIREKIALDLSKIKRDDDKIIDILIEVINDTKIAPEYKECIAESLSHIERNDDKIVDVLIKVLYDIKIDLVVDLSNIKNDEDKIVNVLIDVIKHEIINPFQVVIDSRCRENIIVALSHMERDDDKIVNVLIDVINDDKVNSFKNKGDVVKALLNIKRDDDRIVDILIEVIKDEKIGFLDKEIIAEHISVLIPKNISILNKLDINKYFPKTFIENLPIRTLFQAYDKDYIALKAIVEKAFSNTLSLYIKNNKLCTVYENREIQTQKEVSLKDIERVKKELNL